MSLFSDAMKSSDVVESQSIQAQFAALKLDCDRLRSEAEAADRDRLQQEDSLKELRTHQASLSEQFQSAHASLGAFQRKKALLEAERARLSALLSKEKEELQASQGTLQALEDKHKDSKLKFLEAMDQWNDELDALVTQKEDEEWKRLFGTETVDILLADNVVTEDTKQLWQEAVEEKKREQEIHDAVQEELNEYRLRAQEKSPYIDWRQIERMWEEEANDWEQIERMWEEAANNTSYGTGQGTGQDDDDVAVAEATPYTDILSTLPMSQSTTFHRQGLKILYF